MKDYLTRLADRAVGRGSRVEPRLEPRFASSPENAGAREVDWWDHIAEGPGSAGPDARNPREEVDEGKPPAGEAPS